MIATVPNRLGKIARLPLEIRQQLNERLADNEPGQRLVRWLNSLPKVKEVIEDLFDGRPVSQQNLSAWKLGGFRDWERYQQARAQARDFLDEAEELEEEIDEPEDGSSLLDRVGIRMALSLLQLLRETEQGEKGPERTREMLEITRELARLRRGDHQRQRTAVVQERWRTEQDQAELERFQELQEKRLGELAVFSTEVGAYLGEYIRGLAKGNLEPERENLIRDFFARNAARLREFNLPGLPEGEDLEARVEAMRKKFRPRGAGQRQGTGPGEEKSANPSGEKGGQSRPDKAAQGQTRGEIFSRVEPQSPPNRKCGRDAALAPEPGSPVSGTPRTPSFPETVASDESLRQN